MGGSQEFSESEKPGVFSSVAQGWEEKPAAPQAASEAGETAALWKTHHLENVWL